MPKTWDVVAIRYASKDLDPAHLLLDPDPHDVQGRLDYFVWLIRRDDRVVLVDTGFSREEGASRGRIMNIHPVDALARLGVAADDVTDVVITHLHYDHAGNLDCFPKARFHLQDREMAYATGRCMCHRRMRAPFAVADVKQAIDLVYRERMVFHDGDYQLYPGLNVKLVGGHSRGLQILWLEQEQPLIVASDALHLRRYLDDGQIFPVFGDYEAVLEGYRTLRELAGETGTILPGHDPDVVNLYPRVQADWQDAVRINPRA